MYMHGLHEIYQLLIRYLTKQTYSIHYVTFQSLYCATKEHVNLISFFHNIF